MAGTQDYGTTGHLLRDIKFSPTTGGIIGTTTNDSAGTGFVGEYIESAVSATNTPANGVVGDLTSISLTAGDWNVTFISNFLRNTATMIQFTSILAGISVTSGNSTTGLVQGSNRLDISEGATGIENMLAIIPEYRISISGTTTVYAKFSVTFTGGQPQAAGRLSARRVR